MSRTALVAKSIATFEVMAGRVRLRRAPPASAPVRRTSEVLHVSVDEGELALDPLHVPADCLAIWKIAGFLIWSYFVVSLFLHCLASVYFFTIVYFHCQLRLLKRESLTSSKICHTHKICWSLFWNSWMKWWSLKQCQKSLLQMYLRGTDMTPSCHANIF